MHLTPILSGPELVRIAMTLLHFLWQGAAVAGLTAAVVLMLRLRRGRATYAIYLLGFAAMAACPAITYSLLSHPSRSATERAGDPTQSAGATSDVELRHPSAAVTAVGATDIAFALPRSGASWQGWLRSALPWVPMIWGFGVVVLGARLLLGVVGLRRWRRSAIAMPESFIERVNAIGIRFGMGSFRRVFSSADLVQPMTLGLWRPMVVLPMSLLTQMPPDMLDAVIAHELAHIRRLDPWVNLLQRVVETLLFYHPAVWWLSGRIRIEREICCDEMAVGTIERMTYVSALEQVARLTLGLPSAHVNQLALGFAGRQRHVLNRIRHLLGMPDPRTTAHWPAGALALVVIAAAVGLWRSAALAQPRGGAEASRSSAISPASSAAEGSAGPTTRAPATEVGAAPPMLTLTEDQEAQRREQASRDERRAELSVQEAKLNLESKNVDVRRLQSSHDRGISSQEELDRAILAANLAQIQLERAQIELIDTHAKAESVRKQSFRLSLISSSKTNREGTLRYASDFSLRGRSATVRQVLTQIPTEQAGMTHVFRELDLKGDCRVTLMRQHRSLTQRLVDNVPFEDLISGKAPDVALQPGDEVELHFNVRLADHVQIVIHDKSDKASQKANVTLDRKDMTITQLLAQMKRTEPATAEQKLTWKRSDTSGDTKTLIENSSIKDVLQGKLKDEVVQSGDQIVIDM
jgi:beta-lactamase regulating signal transducer with metallopeptidase domain